MTPPFPFLCNGRLFTLISTPIYTPLFHSLSLTQYLSLSYSPMYVTSLLYFFFLLLLYFLPISLITTLANPYAITFAPLPPPYPSLHYLTTFHHHLPPSTLLHHPPHAAPLCLLACPLFRSTLFYKIAYSLFCAQLTDLKI